MRKKMLRTYTQGLYGRARLHEHSVDLLDEYPGSFDALRDVMEQCYDRIRLMTIDEFIDKEVMIEDSSYREWSLGPLMFELGQTRFYWNPGTGRWIEDETEIPDVPDDGYDQNDPGIMEAV